MSAGWVIGALIMTGGISFAFLGENKLYMFAEKTVIGYGLGYLIAVSANSFRAMGLSRIVKGEYIVLIPILLGLMFLFRFTATRYQFLARYPASMMIGVGIGLGVRTCIRAEVLAQIGATISVPLANLTNVLILAVLISVLSMFMFTEKVGKYFQPLRMPGRCFVMLALGSQLASTIIDCLNGLSSIVVARLLQVFVRI